MFDAKALLDKLAANAAPPSQAPAGGGIGDLLNKITAAAQGSGQGGTGGVADILAKIQQSTGQAVGGAGGLAETLNQVLAQAAQGVKEGADRTGVTEATRSDRACKARPAATHGNRQWER